MCFGCLHVDYEYTDEYADTQKMIIEKKIMISTEMGVGCQNCVHTVPFTYCSMKHKLSYRDFTTCRDLNIDLIIQRFLYESYRIIQKSLYDVYVSWHNLRMSMLQSLNVIKSVYECLYYMAQSLNIIKSLYECLCYMAQSLNIIISLYECLCFMAQSLNIIKSLHVEIFIMCRSAVGR